ncbi:MAG: endonuclease/exonuclease/phosphatase family protein [Planctomycetota bacterium]
MTKLLLTAFMAAAFTLSSGRAQAITLDGQFDDWGADQIAAADERHLYFRVAFPEMRSLRQGNESVVIAIDLDADDSTGDPDAAEPGADLVIRTNTEVEERRWARIAVLATPDGQRQLPVDQSISRFHRQPTHASDTYELRVDRSSGFEGIVPTDALLGSGTAEVTIVRVHAETGRPTSEPVRATFEIPPLETAPLLTDLAIPAKPDGGVRLMAYNVLWSSPTKQDPGPAPFARIFKSANPDIVFLQEWFDRERDRDKTPAQRAAEVEAWFNRYIGGGPWHAAGSAGWGVFVVSRYKPLRAGPEELLAESSTRWDFPVRLASAVFESPIGPLVVGSIHLKCCGTLDTPEDTRRADEARAVNRTLRTLATTSRGFLPVIVGGDYNHNGDPVVVETLSKGLDTDRSDLLTPTAGVLGIGDVYTYGTPERGYWRSRLDYFSVPDDAFEVVESFVIDTSRMTDEALEASRLRRDDIEGSDHMPVLVDLLPKNRVNRR